MIVMDTTVKTTTGIVDRSNWNSGDWDDEPEDKVEWSYLGFDLMICRGTSGAWCGYVDIPAEHKLHADPLHWIEVHGGITLSAIMKSGARRIGFDCAHDCDAWPTRESYSYGGYRSKNFAINETRKLTEQIISGEKDQ